MDYHFISHCIDEIALEGLDGITIPSLWKRLEKRQNFPLILDIETKRYLWKCIACRPEIEFYELPESRSPLNIFNRYEYFDLELGIIMEPTESPVDIYPYKLINENGIRGSCSTYTTRKNITNQIFSPPSQVLLSLDEVIKKWGDEVVVIVANQETRMKSLIEADIDPTIELTEMQYVILERIGRSRFHGEVTQGKASLMALKAKPKNLHYQRKLLLAKNLITKQVHFQKSSSGITGCGSLLHLTRFYVERKPRYLVLLQLLCKILMDKPNKQAPVETLKDMLGLRDSSFKKVFSKHLYKFATVHNISRQEAFPDLPPEEHFHANGKMKMVKALRLLDNVDVNSIGKDDEEDDDEEEEEVQTEKKWHDYLDRTYLQQTLDHLHEYGPNGAGLRELAASLGLPRLEVRLIARNWTRLNAVTTIWKDTGRQRSIRYISKRLEKESDMEQQIREEGLKVLQLTKSDSKPGLEAENTKENANVEARMSCHVDEKIEQDGLKPGSSNLDRAIFGTDTSHLSYRHLKRYNVILQMVQQEQLIDNIVKVKKAIMNEESNEDGSVIDRASVQRLLLELAKAGHINSYKTVLRFGDKIKKMHLICHKDIKITSSILRSAIEQAKMKYFFSPLIKPTKDISKSGSSGSSEKTNTGTKESSSSVPSYELLPGSHRVYGLECKFTRMRRLHEFLFYLVYEYTGDSSRSSFTFWNESTNLPQVYHKDISYKRFVPPLPSHADLNDGWCLLSDVILRLPLSLFLKLINCAFKIPDIDYYLKDPVRQHYLVGHLPEGIRCALLHGRRYIFSFCQNAELLAKIGLLSFGPQQYKEKDQKFVFVHRIGSAKDTRTTAPNYFQTAPDSVYPCKVYEFKTSADVDQFWFDVRNVCIQTPLGCMLNCKGQTLDVERAETKAELVASCMPKNADEIVDDGSIPGDGRGAGGFDSALFAHLRRNWFYVMSPTNPEFKKRHKKGSKTSSNSDEYYLHGIHYMKYLQENETSNPSKRLSWLKKNTLQLSSKSKKKDFEVSYQENRSRRARLLGQKRKPGVKRTVNKKKRVNTRIIRERKFRTRRPYYDDVDKEALKLQTKLRVDWSAQEDSFLLLCKVASLLMAPNHYRQLIVSSMYIRDLIHELLPGSNNKTSRACQRRVVYMMRNPQTKYNVSVFVGEARQDKELMGKVVKPNQPTTNEVVWQNAFRRILMPVLEKFKNLKGIQSSCDLPQTIGELNEKFNLISSDKFLSKQTCELEVKNVVDLHFAVLYTLILSSLCAGKERQKWSYNLYQIYQRYPDTMLRSVFTRLRNDRLIAMFKSKITAARRSRLPPTSWPYQLSIIFEHKFLSKYQPVIFEECDEYLKELIDSSQKDDNEVFVDSNGGITAAVVGLLAKNYVELSIDLAVNIISFDTETERAARKRQRSLTEDDPPPFKKPKSVEQKSSEKNQTETQDEPPKKKSKLSQKEQESSASSKNPNTKSTTSSKASRLSLYMMRQNLNETPSDKVQHAQDYIRINPCTIKCSLNRVGQKLSGVSGERTPAPNVDHDYTDELKEKVEEPEFLLESRIANSIVKSRLALMDARNLDEVLSELRLKKDYSEKKLLDFKSIYEFISLHREVGVTLEHMKMCFKDMNKSKDLFEFLGTLKENNIILEVGTSVRRFVTSTFCKPWALPTLSENEPKKENPTEMEINSEDKIEIDLPQPTTSIISSSLNDKFIPRPWKYPDGSLNVFIFAKILKSVLSHIMINSGIQFGDLVAKFMPALQAVHALELLEILEEAKCINITFLAKKKSSLFTKYTCDNNSVPKKFANPFEDKMLIEATVDCVLMLGDFIKKLS